MASLENILRLHRLWRGGAPGLEKYVFSTGYSALDNELPGGGWPVGVLTEILCGRHGIGELALVLPAAAALSWAGRRLVWLSPPHLPYAPALAAAGLDLAQLAVVHAPGRRDALWAAEQALRARSCHFFLGWLRHAAYDELRRLALAAEASGAFVALFRPPQAAREPSPAALRLALEPRGTVRILKRRGPPAAAPLQLALKRPFDALARHPFPVPSPGRSRADRRLGLPAHA